MSRFVSVVLLSLGFLFAGYGHPAEPPKVLQPQAATAATQSPVPAASPAPVKIETIDLTPYGIRAVIDLPEGCKLEGGYRQGDYRLTITRTDDFKLTIGTASTSSEEEKKRTLANKGVRVLAEVPGGFYAVNGNEAAYSMYKLKKDLMLDVDRYQAEAAPSGSGKRRAVDQVWAAHPLLPANRGSAESGTPA